MLRLIKLISFGTKANFFLYYVKKESKQAEKHIKLKANIKCKPY